MGKGWEFALWFSVQIAHFLRAKEHKCDSLFSKCESLSSLFLYRVTGGNVVFYEEREEQ